MKQKLRFKIEDNKTMTEFTHDFIKLVYRQLMTGLSHIHSFEIKGDSSKNLVLGFINNNNILITSKGIIDNKVGAKLININFNKKLDKVNEDFKHCKETRFDFMPPDLLPLIAEE